MSGSVTVIVRMNILKKKKQMNCVLFILCWEKLRLIIYGNEYCRNLYQDRCTTFFVNSFCSYLLICEMRSMNVTSVSIHHTLLSLCFLDEIMIRILTGRKEYSTNIFASQHRRQLEIPSAFRQRAD